MSVGAPAVFDGLAATYDATFTNTALGGVFRAALWRRLDAAFQPGMRVLDLGCGTGEDAVHLAARGVTVVAADGSAAMLRETERKAAQRAASDRVVTVLCDIAKLGDADHQLKLRVLGAPFDGLYSSFGALNCVEDLSGVAGCVAPLLKPGAPLVLCLMGRVVPWEIVWFLARGDVGRALRRFRKGGALWRGVRVHYPSLRVVRGAFAAAFRVRTVVGIGVLLPPPLAEEWAARHPRWISGLARLERLVEAIPPFPRIADHYVIELVRR